MHREQSSVFKTVNHAKWKLSIQNTGLFFFWKTSQRIFGKFCFLYFFFQKTSLWELFRYIPLRYTRWMFFLKINLVSQKVGWQTRQLPGAANSVTKIYHVLLGPWKSSAWHWSSSKEASSQWFKGWMDLKGMPNGFKPTKAPDEKLPFSKQQTVFELATAFARCYLWWGRCIRRRWFQVTIRIGKEVEEMMGGGAKSEAILQHLSSASTLRVLVNL